MPIRGTVSKSDSGRTNGPQEGPSYGFLYLIKPRPLGGEGGALHPVAGAVRELPAVAHLK
ncbi:hypothetical protein BX281_5855 [Streptomyces sp. Ag82_O1-15]|nr:hypothetical protein BX281_5855 [Streptomyces sp. Ag82_O1-15]